jgi:hypothetical protein
MTAPSIMVVSGPSPALIVQVLTEDIREKTLRYQGPNSFPRSRLITILPMLSHLRFQKEVWFFFIARLYTIPPKTRLLSPDTRTQFMLSMVKLVLNTPLTIGFKDQSIIHSKLLYEKKNHQDWRKLKFVRIMPSSIRHDSRNFATLVNTGVWKRRT